MVCHPSVAVGRRSDQARSAGRRRGSIRDPRQPVFEPRFEHPGSEVDGGQPRAERDSPPSASLSPPGDCPSARTAACGSTGRVIGSVNLRKSTTLTSWTHRRADHRQAGQTPSPDHSSMRVRGWRHGSPQRDLALDFFPENDIQVEIETLVARLLETSRDCCPVSSFSAFTADTDPFAPVKNIHPIRLVVNVASTYSDCTAAHISRTSSSLTPEKSAATNWASASSFST